MRLLALLLLSALFAPLRAEENESGDTVRYVMPEQTVTGTRREFRWIENPSAISTISAKDQPMSRGLGLSDNLLLVPGLAATTRFGTDDIRLAMRGLGARSNSGIRGVRVLYDGIPESEPDGQTRLEGIEVGALDRIEALRGAGSALYGNAAGGVVNLRTAESFLRAGLRVDAQAGGYGFSKIKLSAGTDPAPSDSSVTASLDFRDWKFNLEEGQSGESGVLAVSQTKSSGWRDHSDYEGQIISASWTAKSSRQSELRTVFYFTNVSARLPGTLTRAQFDRDPLQADSIYKALDVRRYTRKGRLGLLYAGRFGPAFRLNITPYSAIKKLDRPRENGQYQAITRYILGGTMQGEWRGTIAGRFETEVIAGSDQQLQDGPVSFYPNVNGRQGDSLLSQEQERQWGQGYFAQWEIEKANSWGAMVGVRYDHIRFDDDFLSDPSPTARYEKEAVTPRFAARYHLSSSLVTFGSVYGGFETPTLSESENTLGVDVKPQRTLTVEAGFRGEQAVRGLEARWEITGYRMTITDAIVPDVIAGEKLFANAAEAVHQGIEVSTKLSLDQLGYAGLAASIGDYSFTSYKTGLGDFSNKKLPGVSPNLLSAVLRWTPHHYFFAELSARVSGSIFANTENTSKADGFRVLNAAVGGRLPVRFMTAAWHAAAENLTNETYVSFVQSNDSKGRYFESGMPRTILAGISIGTLQP